MTPIRISVAPPERSHDCYPGESPDKYGAGTIWECPKCGTMFKVINSVFQVGHSYWTILTDSERKAVLSGQTKAAGVPHANEVSVPQELASGAGTD